jgi:hypothetical protein
LIRAKLNRFLIRKTKPFCRILPNVNQEKENFYYKSEIEAERRRKAEVEIEKLKAELAALRTVK